MIALIWQASTMRWSMGASGGRWITSKPAPMCSERIMFSSRQCLEHRVPVARQEAREALDVRGLEEADRAAALLGDAVHLLDREVDVPHRDEAERDEPARVAAAPTRRWPSRCSPGATTSASSLSPASVNVRALKPAIVGKFIDASTPLAFMSLHPLVDVEARRPQLGVRARVEAPLRPWASRRWRPCRTAWTSPAPGSATRPRRCRRCG